MSSRGQRQGRCAARGAVPGVAAAVTHWACGKKTGGWQRQGVTQGVRISLMRSLTTENRVVIMCRVCLWDWVRAGFQGWNARHDCGEQNAGAKHCAYMQRRATRARAKPAAGPPRPRRLRSGRGSALPARIRAASRQQPPAQTTPPLLSTTRRRHSAAPTAPMRGVVRPALQGRQRWLPLPGAYVPRGHTSQPVAPPRAANWPAGHCRQALAPAMKL